MRLSVFMSLLACVGLALTPIAKPHAHVHANHTDMFVHGGHEHDVEFAPLDFHDDDFHDGNYGSAQHHPSQVFYDLSQGDSRHAAHAHIVKLDPATVQLEWPSPFKALAGFVDDAPQLPRIVATGYRRASSLTTPTQRHYLHPPLRGPPALIP